MPNKLSYGGAVAKKADDLADERALKGPAEQRRKRAGKTAAATNPDVLDPQVAALMTLSADLQRTTSRHLRTLWRDRKLSERGLYILEIIQSGLDRPGRLVEYFDVLPSTITFETDKLVAAGLLVRETDASDRRAIRLSLTEEGRAVHRLTTEAINAVLKPRLARLDPGEFEGLMAVFRKVLEPPAE